MTENLSLDSHRKRVKTYNIEGHAHFYTCSCHERLSLLTNETWRGWLAKEIRNSCDNFRIDLWAYVFMPEHIHLLLKPRKKMYNLALFKKSFKEPLSRRVHEMLETHGSRLLQRLTIRERPGKYSFRFWQEGGGHDFNIWTLPKLIEKARYCHLNPVKRKLVSSPERWHWSSYRWLEMGKKEGEPLRIDDWDERLFDD